MIPAFSRHQGRCVSMQDCVSMNRNNRLAVKYRLRQALCAIVMGCQDVMAGLMRKRRRLPKQDQGREQPGR